MTVAPAVRLMALLGFGRVDHFVTCTSRAFARFERSESLALSLAEDEYPEKDKKAIVPRIARIVMTTISSRRVKAFLPPL